jgi:HPt (histidine-containing phosphotransfer) domain-containing protein
MHPPSLRTALGPAARARKIRENAALARRERQGGFVSAQEPVGAVDFGYLENFAAGDRRVVGEVLALFLEQARAWSGSLDADEPGWRDVVHTIKGAARGVGAFALGDACARAEAEGPQATPELRSALEIAAAEISAYLARDQSA